MTELSNKSDENKPNPTCAWCYGTGTRQPPPGPFMGGCAGPQPCGCSAPAVEPERPTQLRCPRCSATWSEGDGAPVCRDSDCEPGEPVVEPEQPTEPHPAREDSDVDASVSEPISPYGKTTAIATPEAIRSAILDDRYVTGDEISRFEARVMSVGHGVLSDDEWRRLIDTLEATQREVATLRAKLSERRTHIVNGITRNSRQRQANARIQRQYEAMRAERDSYAFEMRSERARADITEAEVERMRPVVEAAVAETISEERAAISDPIQPRRYTRKVAVDAYRVAQQEATDALLVGQDERVDRMMEAD